MKIEHVAIYAKNLEALRDFYVKYFQAISNEMYENPKKGFRSYFLSFSAGARLELMQKESVPEFLERSGRAGYRSHPLRILARVSR